MNTDQKTKLLRLAYREIRQKHFNDFTKLPGVLTQLAAQRPGEFANCKEAVLAEFNNEAAAMPTPDQFRQTVLENQQANGGDYDLGFRVACQKYPAMARRVQIQNEEQQEERADSQKAAKEFGDALDSYFAAHPGLDRKKTTDYTFGYTTVARANPDLMARMIVPRRGPDNRGWVATDSDGRTPAKPLPATDRPAKNSPAERAASYSY